MLFFIFQCLFCLSYLIIASNLLFFLISLAILILFAYNQNIFSKPLMCLTLKRFTEKYKKKKDLKIMTKVELVSQVAEQADFTKKDARAAVDAVLDAIQTALANGEKVQMVGFGNFEVRQRAARKGRNPQTGEEIEIAATKVPAFKAGKALKEAVK